MNGRDSAVTIQTMPDRLDSLTWILVAGFAALFALGSFLCGASPIAGHRAGGVAMPAPSAPPSGRAQAAERWPPRHPLRSAPRYRCADACDAPAAASTRSCAERRDIGR